MVSYWFCPLCGKRRRRRASSKSSLWVAHGATVVLGVQKLSWVLEEKSILGLSSEPHPDLDVGGFSGSSITPSLFKCDVLAIALLEI